MEGIKKRLIGGFTAGLCFLTLMLSGGCENGKEMHQDHGDTDREAQLETDIDLYFCGSELPILEYENDASLVLLNQVRDDIQLYGITVGTASAMLLYVDGEMVFLDHSFQNFYTEYPRVYCSDLDNDGREEIAISHRTATGNPGSWYGLSVCDYEGGWKVWDYDSWQQDVEAMIHYRWDESSGAVLFLDESGSVLTELELPEWTENYPYTGKVDFGNDIRFNAEKMKLEVQPWILLENSLPYDPIVILFDIHYENGGFTIEVTDILDREEYYNQGVWNQDEKAGEETEEDSRQQVEEEYVSTVEEIEALGLPEDMLAFWLVLTGRKPFVSVKDDYQEFYWDEYCWRFGEPAYPYHVSDFMLVDMNGDGAEEVVMHCVPESTQVLYYEDGVVYNYQFVFRGMKRIHINGVYEGSNGAANTVFLRLTELNSYGYEEEILAFCDDGNYEIGGVEVSQQEFSNYVLQTIESVDLAEEFTEAMLDTHLLGDLSEEERFIVEHIPVDEEKAVTINEPGKGNHKMLFWGVANSWRKFTSTDDRDYREQEFYLEDFRRFLGDSEPDYQVEQFALVDLDGDGRDEMILQCYPDAIQVLHMSDEIDYTGLGSIPIGRVVYSYQWKAGDITGIRTNGIYCRYGGSSRFAYYRITEFNAEGYTDELLARSFNGHYEVEGQEVTEKEFYDFIETLEEERIEFYDFTEENLRKYLLGERTGNPYFYSQGNTLLSADIKYMDMESLETVQGELGIEWLRSYDNGDLYKLSVGEVGNITHCLGEERLHIYFYVTSNEIYRLWSYNIQDGEVISFYNDDALLMETFNTDEKLIEHGELVCCMEKVECELEKEEAGKPITEIGMHVSIIPDGKRITYSRADIKPNGEVDFYETFVWKKGKGLVEYRSGYRVEVDILYLENIS